MVSREMIEIILRAEDQASKTIKDNEEKIKKFGQEAQKAHQNASKTSSNFNQKLQETSNKLSKTVENVNKVGNEGSKSFQNLSKSQQDAVTKFNMLDKSTQTTLQAIREVGIESRNMFPDGDKALSSFSQLDNITRSWSGSLDYAKTKMQLLGNDTSTLKGKIQTTGMAIQTYVGTKWDMVKTKVSSVAQGIKGKIGGAIDSVKSKLGGLNGGFTKLNTGAKGASQGLSLLHGAASMAAGMIGFELFNSFVQSGRAAINAQSQLDYFAGRMQKMSGQTKLSAQQFTKFKTELGDLQKEFRKVDMTAVGATAEELAVKMQLPANKLSDLTRMTAVMSSQFVKEGRTQEDAVLAVADALDGQFMKLKEIGITQDMLKNNGWDGNLENQTGLIDALNKSMEDLGYEKTAKDITNLDDAFNVLSVSGGQLLAKVLIPLTPVIVGIVEACVNFADTISSVWNGLPDWGKLAIGFGALAVALGLLVPALSAVEIASIPVIGTLYGLATAEIAVSWPILAIVAAIGVLVAAIYKIGEAFGWWHDIGSMIDAITSNIGRLWNAFVNHPDVKAIVQAIGDTWNWLLEVTKPVVDWLKGIWDEIFPESAKGKVDGTRIIIDSIGLAFQYLTLPIRTLISVIQILYPYMLQFYQGALVPLGNFLVTVFTPVWQLIQTILGQISPMVLSVSDAFTQFVNGQLPLPALVSNIFTNLWNIYTTILTSIGNAVISWASKIVSRGVSAASRFVSGIVNRIASLPGRFASYLWSVVSRIASAGASWVSNGVSKAQSMVNGVITNVSQLPGKVYTEFMNIGSRIVSAGSDLVNKAKNIGKNIVDGLLGAMGIHSPGTIQEKVVLEFVNMVGRVGSKIKSAYDTAKEMGNAIVEGFGNPTLETDVSNILPNQDEVKTQVGVKQELVHPVDTPTTGNTTIDTSMVDSSNAEVIGSFDNLALQTGNALQTMVDKDRIAYETIRNNDNTQLSAMTSNLQGKMSNMTNNVRTSMNNIVNKNKTGMNTVKNTTKAQLDNIVTKTKNANSKMIDSWKHMKDGIVSAANKIKTESTTHFKNLESTIGNFYRKLQNPGGFGAGPGNGRVSTAKPLKRASSNGFRNITNAIRKAQLPQYLSLGQIRSNPFIDNSNIGDYITTSGRTNRFSVSDLVRSGNIKIPIGLEDPKNKGAGSWTSGVGNHVKKIKDTSKNWSMKGPKIIGKYATSIGFKVKDFLDGTPKINFNTFKKMAEDVFSQCHYEFYWDSQKYGNWMTAFQHGGMNCSDSSDALIAMAHACGLSASKVHGHWNQYGHFWANVAGRKMDTTGWMNQRNWTPSASHAGPAPKGFGFNDLINAIKDIFKDDDPTTSSGGLGENPGAVDTIEGNLTITHEFVNLPENISAEEVARLINDVPDDENWIKSLVRNIRFQKWDLKEKARLEAKNNRAKGV